MASKMLLSVDKSALAPENENYPMRPGTLYALKKLSENGIGLTGNLEQFDTEILRLLEQENIPFQKVGKPDNFPENENRIVVTTDPTGNLVLQDRPGESRKALTFPEWDTLVRHLLLKHRSAEHTRKTAETDISVTINLDGTGESDINTGIPFYDHMLEQIAKHGYMDLTLHCHGDLQIDEHHTIEDTAITLGEAIGIALNDKRGTGRYGFMVAMDETRALAAIDLSGRPWCVFEGSFHREKVGDFPTEMASHFFHSLAMALKATLHVAVKGTNDHHQIEACFKALGRSLRQAVDRNENYLDILPSSKGVL